ncbi:MAG: hypothetical protein ACRC9L_02480 [Brevinema sp.]
MTIKPISKPFTPIEPITRLKPNLDKNEGNDDIKKSFDQFLEEATKRIKGDDTHAN